jgi:hypothetical protein
MNGTRNLNVIPLLQIMIHASFAALKTFVILLSKTIWAEGFTAKLMMDP